MANIQAAALAKAIRLALLGPVDDRIVAAGIDGGPTKLYGALESFRVNNIHDFCEKLIDTGYIRVDESVLDR